MSCAIDWDMVALGRAGRFMKDDVAGVEQVMAACGYLAADPRPPGSAEYGSPDDRRIHVGRYRVFYEIDDAAEQITITHLGRTP